MQRNSVPVHITRDITCNNHKHAMSHKCRPGIQDVDVLARAYNVMDFVTSEQPNNYRVLIPTVPATGEILGFIPAGRARHFGQDVAVTMVFFGTLSDLPLTHEVSG
jgi:hypothetical protein